MSRRHREEVLDAIASATSRPKTDLARAATGMRTLGLPPEMVVEVVAAYLDWMEALRRERVGR